ncbi:aminopeptidase N [Cohaesibacter sp. CAU 1516]|uniref:aminopeptidase N n=1 Tax=Cohaesibacter sp. CAU 1516 TaxID=2576038 RepID=UPI0010FF22EF|nr:aminopeptidase N [Cohaesibacter sp. CAU 1516]TLP44798.1 aminopeptidase N [Cohaesibacter sp. CAU 1516]
MTKDKKIVRLCNYKPTPYTIEHVSLVIRLDPEETTVISRLTIVPRAAYPAGHCLILDGDGLDFVDARLDGKEMWEERFSANPMRFSLNHAPHRRFTLEITTRLSPNQNTQLMGLYSSNGAFCTQCEAEGFRRITYFYDRPDILSTYDVRIEAPKRLTHLLANGNLVESGELLPPDGNIDGEAWHYALWRDPFPKPSYLFAMVAGDLACVEDHFVTRSNRKISLKIFVEHGKEDRVAYAMDSLKRSMAWDETAYGREYDLDTFMIVAVSDFNFGAMENKGLNIFNDKYVLAKPETATDTDYALIEAVIAHEYFHNWSGNRVTCRDWFQLCLKEGLTVFRDQEFSSDMRSRPVKRIADVRELRSRQFPEDSGPLAHPVRPDSYAEINNFYTATVYEKGAEICRMLHSLVGSEGFRESLDLYFDRFDGQAVTIEDFLACFSETCAVDLTQFALWYEQAGTPTVVATYFYDPKHKQLSLTLQQSCPPSPGQTTKKLMHIPLRIGLVARDGSRLRFEAIHDRKSGEQVGDRDCTLLHITDRQHQFVFSGVEKDAIPSMLRGFSAPVHLRTNLTLDDNLILMRHDSDPYNRWEAAQQIFTEHLVEQSNAHRPSIADCDRPVVCEVDPLLVSALDACLFDERLEHAFRAQMLRLPSEGDIARLIAKDVDPDAIHAARSKLRQELASQLGDRLIALYTSLQDDKPYSPNAAAAGRRDLRNCLLDLLLATKAEAVTTLAQHHYENATNMTDRFAALSSLATNRPATAEGLLADFHQRYADDALVVDKWLSLQASIPEQGTIARLRTLMKAPFFSMENPNRVRALIGAFAVNNALQFNRKDGAGFSLLADVVLEQDTVNPQTAARLANNFRSWRALEADRQTSAEHALRRIAESSMLSKDVADIVNRCLQ